MQAHFLEWSLKYIRKKLFVFVIVIKEHGFHGLIGMCFVVTEGFPNIHMEEDIFLLPIAMSFRTEIETMVRKLTINVGQLSENCFLRNFEMAIAK